VPSRTACSTPCWRDLLRITASEYGFIAEVWRTPEGAPYLKIFTMTNMAWDDASRATFERDRCERHRVSAICARCSAPRC
jgi:hypothetical protein